MGTIGLQGIQGFFCVFFMKKEEEKHDMVW